MTTEAGAVRRFFDSYWEHKRMRRLDSTASFARSATFKAYSLVSDGRGKRFLEIGPGEGIDLEGLSRLGARVAGIDLSRVGLSIAGSRCPHCDLLVMDGATMGFGDSVFDVVFSRTLLMHVGKEPFLRECRRVLRPGGRAVFIEPLRSNPFVIPYRAAISSGRRIAPEYLGNRDVNDMRRIFSSVSVWHFYLLSVIAAPFVSLVPRARSLFLPLEWLDRALLFAVPFLRSFCWISVIECTR